MRTNPTGSSDRRRSRRDLLAAGALSLAAARVGAEDPPTKALIAITLDLEMSRNFPRWDDSEWDYQKGNLNRETCGYAREAARRVKAAGGVIQFFALGRTMEQPEVGWLKEIAEAGHPIGNHTYDHVNVLATRPEDVQFRFKRAPWLIEGKTVPEVLRENIRLASEALRIRAGVRVNGFRTPGGFASGLSDRPDLRKLLLEIGFRWVSSRYPAHPVGPPGERPSREVLDGIVAAQIQAQPFAYPDGLVEIPMSPISDINAFRTGRWKLEDFLTAIRLGVEGAIERRAVYDFLGHPSCLYITDPKFRTIDLICELVRKAGDRAVIVGLDALAERVR
jgi:peptidoglycan/xylan/chitin deacetylase (PgdA/CDA1 family)